nr:retrovirus-related Pol polyprotein from transposon TNT 1-94 [Tanacetum cinerariifolium]GEX65422.1 retrovirus-related Pol polyprotein from transposon TNT 1-94 [Tanacetum cinerariifolium]
MMVMKGNMFWIIPMQTSTMWKIREKTCSTSSTLLNKSFPHANLNLFDLKNTKVHNLALQLKITRLTLDNKSLKDEVSDLKKSLRNRPPVKSPLINYSLSKFLTSPDVTSGIEFVNDNQEPLLHLPKLSRLSLLWLKLSEFSTSEDKKWKKPSMSLSMKLMDVKNAFLNRKLPKEVYVQQPHGFKSSEFPNYVCKLDKALYGPKQDPKHGIWYPKGYGFDLKAYANSDYARCNIYMKSTSGGCQILDGKLVCWSAKKQNSVAMSYAEYVAIVGCYAQVM